MGTWRKGKGEGELLSGCLGEGERGKEEGGEGEGELVEGKEETILLLWKGRKR